MVPYGNRNYWYVANSKWMFINDHQIDIRYAGISMLGKHISELSLQRIGSHFISIHIYSLAREEIIRTHIIQSGNMVFVWVSEQNSIKRIIVDSQHLLPEIRSSINNNGCGGRLYQ